LERDVALIRNITDTRAFRSFLRLLAGRAGQLLNMSALANDVGVSAVTIKEWISVLETSYIVHLVQPYHKNFNKRISKSPKIYFLDTGLLCFLLNIHNQDVLSSHPLVGAIFENFIISETLKFRWNSGEFGPIYFWRENNGKEIDLIIENEENTLAIEIKSGKTFSLSYFNNLKDWLKLSNIEADNAAVVYNGSHSMNTKNGALLQWHELEVFLKNKNRD
jgi:predicted AAA+ superfamily ATPase